MLDDNVLPKVEASRHKIKQACGWATPTQTPEFPGFAPVQGGAAQIPEIPGFDFAGEGVAQNPQIVDFAPTTMDEAISASNDGTERQATGLDLLRQVVRVLRHVAHNVDTLPAGDEVEHELDQIAHTLATIRSSVQRR